MGIISQNKSNIAIAVCVTAVLGFSLFYYFYKKETEKKRRRAKVRKRTPKKRIELKEKRQRSATASRVPSSESSSKKSRFLDSSSSFLTTATALSLTDRKSPMLSEDSIIRTARMKEYSPPSDLPSLSSWQSSSTIRSTADSSLSRSVDKGTISTSTKSTSSSKSKNDSFAENYPPSNLRKFKKLKPPMVSKKQQELLEQNLFASETTDTVSVESSTSDEHVKIKATKSPGKALHLKDETPSPTSAIPIDSYCYCGQDVAVSSKITGELDKNCKVELLPTIVKPVSFDPYSPEDLTLVEGASEEISPIALQVTPAPENHQVIVPFLPILHAITYASKHAELLQELIQNYEYYESQSLDST